MPGSSGDRDTPARAWARALSNVAQIVDGGPLFSQRLDELAQIHGERIALQGQDGGLSYRAVAALKNSVAGWARRCGIRQGDVVCLLLPNHPAYPAYWSGLNQAGAVAALINTNLRRDGLVQAISAAGATHLIVAAELLSGIVDVADRLPHGLKCWIVGASADADRPAGASPLTLHPEPTSTSYSAGSLSDTALLIYTSGTSGWPKPARITQFRILEWSLWFTGIMGIDQDDRLYDCLPMYHSTGGVAAIGGTLLAGGCAIIRRGFSAREFWGDVSAERCSVFIYIGELCRYLLGTSDGIGDTAHRLRLACGNGLRPEIWQAFQSRFRIPSVIEFYASTEGNVSLYNCEGKPGSIGRIPGFLRHRFPVRLARCDAETGKLLRDGGNCIVCDPGEPGEALGRISVRPDTPGWFDGYVDGAATEDKIVRNAFSPGDAWFRTGDLMQQDAAGFFYFIDRVGDTYRWKGENVSTTQVAELMCGVPAVTAAVVFGVAMPDQDGKAGMAAITVRDDFQIAQLHAHLTMELPRYAVPLFVRVCSSLETTSTHKFVKAQLMRDGYSRIESGDSLYRLDAITDSYVEWTAVTRESADCATSMPPADHRRHHASGVPASSAPNLATFVLQPPPSAVLRSAAPV